MQNYQYTVEERFKKYVQVDTTANPLSETFPSSDGQKVLGAQLVNELKNLGLSDATMDEWGYVFATIKSNTENKVPTICFCAHMHFECAGEGCETSVKIGSCPSLFVGMLQVWCQHTLLEAIV